MGKESRVSGEADTRTSESIQETVRAAADYLRSCGAKNVYLFGSASKGTFKENSDVDMAVEGLPPEIFFRAMGELFRILDRPVDLIDLDEDSPLTRVLK
ncbi:MAG: nucleotidyltransferase domain-containing protein, partial [Deltaproteobacteria bacterium]